MCMLEPKTTYLKISGASLGQKGFSLVEVIVAGALMIVICVGVLTVFSYVTNINRGNNIRTQALSALQQEIEFYRSSLYSMKGRVTDLETNPSRLQLP
jgi:type II secretory pathway pseudopilin PulG